MEVASREQGKSRFRVRVLAVSYGPVSLGFAFGFFYF